jgi:hypothetical protein
MSYRLDIKKDPLGENKGSKTEGLVVTNECKENGRLEAGS